jgi:hypothetical protein
MKGKVALSISRCVDPFPPQAAIVTLTALRSVERDAVFREGGRS